MALYICRNKNDRSLRSILRDQNVYILLGKGYGKKNFLHLYLVFLLIWKTVMDSFNGFSKICHIACMVNTSWSGQTLFGSSIVTSNKHYVCIVLEVFLSFLLKKSLNAENIKSPVSTRDREQRNSLCKHVFLTALILRYIHR